MQPPPREPSDDDLRLIKRKGTPKLVRARRGLENSSEGRTFSEQDFLLIREQDIELGSMHFYRRFNR